MDVPMLKNAKQLTSAKTQKCCSYICALVHKQTARLHQLSFFSVHHKQTTKCVLACSSANSSAYRIPHSSQCKAKRQHSSGCCIPLWAHCSRHC